MKNPILFRIFALVISISLLTGVSPSFAASYNSRVTDAPMQMSDECMQMMHMKADGSAEHQKAPCKMPAGDCHACCTSMATAMVAPQVALLKTSVSARMTWSVAALPAGISHPPALPPPILRA